MTARTAACPGVDVSGRVCGYTNDGHESVCGEPIAYEIRFRDWPSHYRAGACETHALDARDLDVERIWSVTR